MSLASRTRAVFGATSAALACAFALAACTPGGGDYISDNPFGSNPSYSDGATGSSSGAGGSDANGGGGSDAGRAIAEADIIQINGPRLYALSRYGGLSIIDISTPDQLTMLGRYHASGVPFEMYLRDNTVYAMFSGWGQYVCNDAQTSCEWIQSSHIEALDVTNPAHIVKLGSFELPGDISDSRVVGDVLYAVTYEDGYCWNCGSQPSTTVTSLDVGDPAHIAVVDHLNFTTPDPNGYGWWKRSITVNQDRMYVGGVDWDGNGEGHSTIQIVDISDPAGHLSKGAAITARGQIESRWQMDEKDGVLRVISQPGVWWTQDVPTVQTFQINSSYDVAPLAELDLVLPQPERLRSVRFDGDRAYAITAVQMDPLFTIDLTDPAHPAQVGELQMPGWVYFMEPRGDRLYALGYEQNNPEGSLAVSLFDVADLANPTMIQRVNFGGDWSNLPEDQDRIHKSFNIDDQRGAIFVPFSAWSYDQSNDYWGCGSYASGIQIIDFTHDSLTKRGVAAEKGEARRAFVHGDRLFGVSDAQVATFNIGNRDAPAQTAQIALSTDVSHAVVAGNKVVRLSNDWWTGAARLDIVPATDPGRATPIGSFDLAALDPNSDEYGWCWGWSYYGARVFSNGNFVYLVRTNNYYWGYYEGGGYSGDGPSADIVVIDISNPAAPKARGSIKFPLPLWYRWYGGVVSGGDDVVQVGSAIAFRSLSTPSDPYGSYDPNAVETATVEIVDLSNPDSPARKSVALADGFGHTALIASGHTIRTSHWSPVEGQPSKVRFYVDQIDLADPTAPTLDSINVPGSLLAYDAPSERLLTVDYQHVTHTGVSAKTCNELFEGNAQYTPDDPNAWDWENGSGSCVGLHRTLKLVEIEGINADVISEVTVDDKFGLSSPLAGDDRVFFNVNNYYYDGVGSGPKMLTIGGMRDGDLRVVSKKLNDYGYATAVSGKKLVMVGYNPPGLSVLDAADLDHLTVTREADLNGYSYDVTMMGDTALCSLGPWGLQSVDISH